MLPLSRFAFYVQLRPNSPNCVAKLRRDPLSVLAKHMRIDRLRDWRAVRVTESLLTQFLRCSATAHQSRVRKQRDSTPISRDRLSYHS